MSTQRIQTRKAQLSQTPTPLPDSTTTTATPLAELPAYLTTAQAAAYLQLARRTVANWCNDGTLAAANVGGEGRAKNWRIPRSEIQRILNA
jgi:excisionase family DNA binding protein